VLLLFFIFEVPDRPLLKKLVGFKFWFGFRLPHH